MTTPVFVIHGTANRDPKTLEERVAKLQRRLGSRWVLYPVFWGDLGSGADHGLFRHVVPGYHQPLPEVRGPSDELPIDENLESLAVALATAAEPGSLTAGLSNEADRLDMVASGVRRALERDGQFDDELAEEIVDTIAQEWTSDMTWLWQVTDPVLLAEVGAGVAADFLRALAEDEIEVREKNMQKLVHASLSTLNNVIGAALSAAGDRVTRWVQLGLAKLFAETLGDVIVYQRRQHEIHDRVRQVISGVDERLGRSPEHPVHLVGHSLGATIALDVATLPANSAPGPVWTDAVVTFGSLWSVFHLCDPRSAGIRPYAGHPVPLPRSVRRWVNLWEPLDPFAFLAANMFTLADGTAPKDVQVKHCYSAGLGTHSVYWEAPQLISELAQAFALRPQDNVS